MEEKMRIKEFSERVGLTPYTLRYYEKIGVLRPIKRTTNRYREYDERDISWMEFVLRLKKTGMPIKKIKEYAELRSEGDETKNQRQKILEDHEEILKQKIEEQMKHLQRIQEKIEYYKKM